MAVEGGEPPEEEQQRMQLEGLDLWPSFLWWCQGSPRFPINNLGLFGGAHEEACGPFTGSRRVGCQNNRISR